MINNFSKHYISVPSKDEEGLYRIKSVWNQNDFVLSISLIDGSNAFQANVTEDHLQQCAIKFKMMFSDYINEIKTSLSEDNNKQYAYSRQDTKLILFRRKEKFNIKFAEFMLEHTDFHKMALNFVDEMFSFVETYRDQISIFKSKLENVTAEKESNVKKFEDYVLLKNATERELYEKFQLVLNEKKKRIAYLQESLNSQMAGNSCKKEKTNESQFVKQIEKISDSETDISDEESSKKVIHHVQIEQYSSTSKKKVDAVSDMGNHCAFNDLPKRAKISKHENFIENKSKDNELNAIDIDIPVVSEEKCDKMSVNIIQADTECRTNNTNNIQHSQDSLDFNTEDLIDRL